MSRFRAALLVSATILITAFLHAQTPVANPPTQAGRTALTAYLDDLAFHQTAARRAAIARIHTRAQAEARQRAVRAKILALFGALPARIPLNTRITGSTTLPDGIRVDKLLFDSQTNFPITALLYTPAPPPAPAAATSPSFPAIIMAPGHSPAGKAGDVAFATAFARAGFVVLSYDPIGQGERLQYLDPASPRDKPVSFAGKPTGEHGEAGLQPTLLGDSLARYFLWDGMRAVDLLQSLPNVDPHRIGAFGCSGGGTMTAMLAALDPRIAAAGVACYTTSWDALLPSATGVQDTEQSTANFISSGLDFPDWSESFAPKPYAIIATTADMFPFAGAQSTYAEASRFYSLFPSTNLSSRPERAARSGETRTSALTNASANLSFITGPGGHGNLRPILPQILAFFTTHLHPNAYYAKNLPPIADPFASPASAVMLSGARSSPNSDAVILSGARSAPNQNAVILSGARSAQSKDPDAAHPTPTAAPLSTQTAQRPPPPPASLTQVTPTGQLSSSYPNIATIFTLNEARAATITTPHPQTLAALQQAVREATRTQRRAGKCLFHADPAFTADCISQGSPAVKVIATDLHYEDHGDTEMDLVELRFQYDDGTYFNALLADHESPQPHDGIVLLRDDFTAIGEPTAQLRAEVLHRAQDGHVVLAVQPRPSPPGAEETKSPLLGPYYLTGLRAGLVGRTLIGLRADDIFAVDDYLATDLSRHFRPLHGPQFVLTAEASGHLALVLLHAAILDPRIHHVTVDNFLPSYRTLITQPLPKDAPQDLLPGVLRQYDIPDLVRLLGPKLTFPPR